ncbi:MAG: ATPase with chaperone activity [Proteobacteria bacterium]|nr:ATPase with chaperone activity [Burkholderiales bacterium]
MSDENQLVIPRPFIELYIAPGAIKPRLPRAAIAERYDLCEDMAQMLTEAAAAKRHELGITEQQVLEQVRRGLLAEGSVVDGDEAGWVVCRLAEVLGWPIPGWARKP